MKKHWKYFKYIVRHKWFVFLECCKLGIPFRGLMHDFSKLYPSEWFPYTNYFYGGEYSVAGTNLHASAFNKAWLHHQNRNKHHWQYWILTGDNGTVVPLEIPMTYRKEMLADWIGAGRAITGKLDVYNWYMKNKDIMVLAKETRSWISEKISNLSGI